jgi:hypothetical protein
MNALLDVTFPLNDPDLCCTFNVFRQHETISDQGRSVVTTELFPNVVGVVTSGKTNELSRGDNYDVNSRSLTVISRFPLQGETTGVKPDIIYWRGSPFLVKFCDIYQHFGPGFYESECESIKHTDEAVPPGWLGNAVGTVVGGSQLNFNLPQNCALEAVCF